VDSEKHIEDQEYREAKGARVELLQRHRGAGLESSGSPGGDGSDLESFGGDHRYLLVRPCERFAGDGRSGLPRHLVTGECCGDGICSPARFEAFESCPRDCSEVEAPKTKSTRVLPPTQTTLFGELEGMEHDEYHCEDLYETVKGTDECVCSCRPHRPSIWLTDLLARDKAGTLPFHMPGRGSIAVEFGAGEGQDSRNMATFAGYAVTSIDVSPTAIAQAKNYTSPEMLGNGAGQIEFVAYDATAMPVPKKRVDFLFDATVYCGLRHLYLNKLYDVWSRVATPGHTLVNIQCWNEESGIYGAIPKTKRDMEADFEPIFDILHSESCMKNQGMVGWCFYMKIKSPEVRNHTAAERLKTQLAVRSGDIEFVRKKLEGRSENMSTAELITLYHIALTNWHMPLMKYLRSMFPKQNDPFLPVVYGRDAEAETIKAEDQRDGSESTMARFVLQYVKTDWERAESQLILGDFGNDSKTDN